ncbi:hypothetical protein ABKN59_009896 [Abortiporus biennis]
MHSELILLPYTIRSSIDDTNFLLSNSDQDLNYVRFSLAAHESVQANLQTDIKLLRLLLPLPNENWKKAQPRPHVLSL